MSRNEDILAELELAKMSKVIALLREKENELLFFVMDEFCDRTGCRIEAGEFALGVYYAQSIDDFVRLSSSGVSIDKMVSDHSLQEKSDHTLDPYARAVTIKSYERSIFFIYINCEIISENLKYYRVSLEENLTKTLIHEFVHLCEHLSETRVMKWASQEIDGISDKIYTKWKEKQERK